MNVTYNKKYYKIGEISKSLNIEPHVLRFWETRFTQLKPKKSKSSGHRRYTQKDFDLIIKIHDLLYNKNFKIEGAIKELSTINEIETKESNIKSDFILDKDSIKEELIALKNLIKDL